MNGLKITGISLALSARSDVLETALDAGYTHGIGYWADFKQGKRVDIDGESRLGWINLFDREGAGKTDSTPDSRYRVGVNQEPEHIGINGEHIEQAVAKMLADPDGCDCLGWVSQLLDPDSLDGPLSDAIIQVACFGKVIYG